MKRQEIFIVVGNIGIVYSGKSKIKAQQVFREYTRLSRSGIGKAAGESVSMFMNGEEIQTSIGFLDLGMD